MGIRRGEHSKSCWPPWTPRSPSSRRCGSARNPGKRPMSSSLPTDPGHGATRPSSPFHSLRPSSPANGARREARSIFSRFDQTNCWIGCRGRSVLHTIPMHSRWTIVGTSMSPRFRPGTRVAISPRSAVAVGDDVLVRLRAPLEAGTEHALAMQLIRRAAQIFELQQFNPDLKVQIEADEVETVFKIVGELI